MGQVLGFLLNDEERNNKKEELWYPTYNYGTVKLRPPPQLRPQPPQQQPQPPPLTVSIGGYNRQQRILVVGDGDFSFSASLALAFASASNIVSTSLDSLEFLMKNYKRSMSNINELRRRGSNVLHGVDATQIANHSHFSHIKFDRIIFNFPLAGFFPRDVPRQLQIQVNQALVGGFMANAKKMIKVDGEIHITHKAYGFYKQWDLEKLGQSEGLWLKEEVDFIAGDYPGYHTKYGFGGDKDFDCSNSKTYKFRRHIYNLSYSSD